MAERTLILGSSPLARALVDEINARPQGRYTVIGVVSETPVTRSRSFDCPVLGTLDDLPRVVAAYRPQRIVIALGERREALPVDQLVEARTRDGIQVEQGTDVYEWLTGKLAIESLTPSNLIFSRDFRPMRLTQYAARAISVVVSLIGLTLTFPLLALVALAVKLDSRGPAFFVQDRVGLGGRRFRLYKFRSMQDTKARSEWAEDNDDRITRVGRFLRKYRIDELPQLYNVLRGDMNIVGPRPHPLSNFEMFVLVSRNTPQHGSQIPYYSLRASVRPGITGWAQVRYKYANGLGEEMEKLRYDLYYIKHCSLVLDTRILFETVRVIVAGRGEVEASATGQPQRSL